MQSKASYFNTTLFRKNLTRFCLLWIVYLGFWLVALPFNFLQSFQYDNVMCWELQYVLLSSGAKIGVVVNFVYGLMCALAVFSYLFSARSANMLHAMPLRREGMFLTNFCSGLLFGVLPNLAVMLLTLLAEAVIGIVLVQATVQWFLLNTLSFLFFYGFSVFLVQLTGNGFFLPFLYGILNFTAIGVEGVFRTLLRIFVYGYDEARFGTVAKLSPLFYLEAEADIVGENILYNTNDVLVNIHYVYDGWIYLLVLAAVGLVFAGVAFVLYRHRNIESAGDVIAIRQLRPVFKYCFAVGIALVFGIMLYSFIQKPVGAVALFIEIACFMVIGTFIGYFLAEILLQKSFRVFRKGWLGFAIVSLCMLAMLTAIDCDLFGYEKYVPEAGDVESVLVGYSETGEGSTDEALIEKTIQLHKKAIQEKDEQQKNQIASYSYYNAIEDDGTHKAEWNSWGCSIRYKLKSGKTVIRYYEISCKESELYDSDSLAAAYISVFNDPNFVVLRSVPALEVRSARDIRYCNISYQTLGRKQEVEASWSGYDDGYQYQSLTTEQAYELFTTCILPDLQDGLMGDIIFVGDSQGAWTENGKADGSTDNTVFIGDMSERNYAVTIELGFRNGSKENDSLTYYYTPTVFSERTNAYLEALGISLVTEKEIQDQTSAAAQG